MYTLLALAAVALLAAAPATGATLPCGQTPAIEPSFRVNHARSAGSSLAPTKAAHITRGRNQIYGEFPSFVSLRSRRGNIQCGGTLLTRRLVLTAAHCVARQGSLEGWHALLGPYRPHKNESSAVVALSGRPCLAPNYEPDTGRHDWALLLLPPVDSELDDYVQPACMPRERDDAARAPSNSSASSCWLVGAGASAFEGSEGQGVKWPEYVQKLRVRERPCPQHAPQGPETICYQAAGEAEAHRASQCFGDSGGPVLCNEERDGNNRWSLVALASSGFFDDSCNFFWDALLPGVYMNVARIRPQMERACDWMISQQADRW